MKIAVTAEGADLEAQVSSKFGLSPYLLIVDQESMDFEVVPNPAAQSTTGTGRSAMTENVSLAISNNVQAVITGFCGPMPKNHLSANGIEVIDGQSGTVRENIERYKRDKLENVGAKAQPAVRGVILDKASVLLALKKTVRQFAMMLPIMAGIILLMGLLITFVSREFLTSIFSANPYLDTILGACFGSILAGNPINSYVIGAGLLEHGVSLFAVTAFILTWVTVGLIQLPAEMASLGKRFALWRNALCFILSIPTALLTVAIMNLFTG